MEDNNQKDNQDTNKNGLNSIALGAIVLVIMIAIGGFIYLSQNTHEDNNQQIATNQVDITPTTFIEENNVEGIEDNEEVRVIEIEAGSFFYNPDEIRVQQGETVQIVMTSVDMMHDFNIDELGVSLPITQAGETNSVTFTADEVGEFEYYCSVGNHRQMGQVGTLIVEE